MIGWVERPFEPPYRCALTLRDEPAEGPYYSSGYYYFQASPGQDGPRPGHFEQLYLAPQAIREICGAEGSPLVVYTRDEAADLNATLEARNDECADLSAQLEEAHARIAELEQHLNPDSMADALIVRLDERYAKRAGRKPSHPDAA